MLDGLGGVVLSDDRLVADLRARRTSLVDARLMNTAPPIVEEALALWQDFIYLRVDDPPDHRELPP